MLLTRRRAAPERGPFGRARRAWRGWRRSRPFWGGLFTVLAGAEICSIPLAPLEVMLHQGIAGIFSVLIGLLLVLMGLTFWFAPHYRSLAGIVTVMLAASALVLSNLGGFFLGTVVAIVGGGLGFGWQPLPTAEESDTDASPDDGQAGPPEGDADPKAVPPARSTHPQ